MTEEVAEELIDGRWYPHGDYEQWEITPEFIENHISIRDIGYYSGSWPDLAAEYGYCLKLHEYHSIYEQAHYASRAMVHSSVLNQASLNHYRQAAFDEAYERGFMEGQSKVAKQLYELANMGEYKAIDKFLEVRGAYGKENVDTGPAVQVTLDVGIKEVKEVKEEQGNLISFPAK